MYRKPNLTSASSMIQEKSIPKNKAQVRSENDKLKQAASIVTSNLTVSNQIQQHFSFKLQQPVSLDSPTIGWSYNVPVLSPNEKFLYLCTEGFTTVLLDFIGDQFPQTISVGLLNYSGFTGKNGVATNKIMVLNLYQVSSSINPQGIQYRDLIYKSEGNVMWDLGSMRSLSFVLYLDEQVTPINFPITNPVNLTFKILHLSI